jgi:hypothetical protein
MEDANGKAFGGQSVEDRELKSRRVRALGARINRTAGRYLEPIIKNGSSDDTFIRERRYRRGKGVQHAALCESPKFPAKSLRN